MQKAKKTKKITCLRHPRYEPGQFPHLDCTTCCKLYRDHVKQAYRGLERIGQEHQTQTFDPSTI